MVPDLSISTYLDFEIRSYRDNITKGILGYATAVYQYNVTKPYLSLLVGCILDWTGIQVLNIQQSRRFTIMPTALLVLLLTKNTLFSFYQQRYIQWSTRNTISRSVSIAGYIIKVKPKSNDVLNALGCQTCEVKGNTYWNDKDLFLATNMS